MPIHPTRSLRSIRFRLTAWHTVALAAVLAAFATATALFLGDLTRDRSDRLLEATTLAFHHVFEEEYSHHRHLETAAAQAVAEFRFSGHRVQVYDDFGRLVADSDSAVGRPDSASEPADAAVEPSGATVAHEYSPAEATHEDSHVHHLLAAAADRPALATLDLAGEPVRASAITNRVGDRPFTLLVLQTEHPEDGVLRDFVKAIAIAIPIALLLAAAIGYALARKALMPVMAMGEQAARIGAESLHERLAVPDRTTSSDASPPSSTASSAASSTPSPSSGTSWPAPPTISAPRSRSSAPRPTSPSPASTAPPPNTATPSRSSAREPPNSPPSSKTSSP